MTAHIRRLFFVHHRDALCQKDVEVSTTNRLTGGLTS